MNFHRLHALLFTFSLSICCFAGVEFSSLDINAENELLYIAEHKVPGNFSYKSVFRTQIKDSSGSEKNQLLTCFPESMELISGNSVLQIRNRYGTALYSFASSNLYYLQHREQLPLFTARPVPVAVSPNGKWFCFIRHSSSEFVNGTLMLQNAETREAFVLNPNVPFSYKEVPVKWSPDSSTVLYEKNGKICFANPDAMQRKVQLDEKFRVIGRGNINCVNFTRSQQLVYIDYDIVYALNVSELYTMALYSSYIGMGAAIARLPYAFNNQKDRFSVNDDASQLFVIQNNKTVSYYALSQGKFARAEILYSQPVVDSQANVLAMSVTWPEGKKTAPVLFVESLALYSGNRILKVYAFDNILKEKLNVQEPSCFASNPSGTKLACYFSGAVNVYDTSTWKKLASLPSETAACLLWRDNDVLIVGGQEVVRAWNVAGGTYKTLFLASAKKVFWNSKASLIQAQTSSSVFTYNAEKNTWATDSNHPLPARNSVQNGRFRVYTAESKNKKYENAVYVRTLTGNALTFPLFAEPVKALPVAKKVALIFDAVDCADGVPEILQVLKQNRLKTTFFINGEFIRRYPEETVQLALSGSECASMFFTAADLTAKGFIIDEEFIRRGLARNEDDFFACTGKELSLLWHAPYYKANPTVINAGQKAGYAYISVEGGNKDAVVLESNSSEYRTASQLIEEYLQELKSGKPTLSVIPVSTGVSSGTRSDFLYEKLNLLINLLLDCGYEIVPVSSLR